MLVTSYETEIGLPACSADRERVTMIGHVHADISPVFPYLNAILPAALLHTRAETLRFRFDGHPVALQPYRMAIGGLEDADEGVETMTRLQQLLNDTWARRGEIVPSSVERRRLGPLPVYKLLPGTNCGACGYPTCLVFANKLVVGQADMAECTPLCTEEAYRDRHAQLRAMIDAAPAA
jgi:ArsR family metal-binding transcriptional regulator